MDPADLRLAANDWIKEFAVALKNAGLYSFEHPRSRDSVSRSYDRLRLLLKGYPAITLTRAEGRLSVEGAALDRDRVVSTQIYHDLTARDVQAIEFGANVSLEEYTSLLRSLLLRPERIHERGGLASVLLDEGVSSITVNRTRIGRLPEAVDLMTDLSLMDLIAGRSGAVGGETIGSLMAKDPEGLARALGQAAARRDRSPSGPDYDFRAEQVADTMERITERALEEKKRERPEILADLARIFGFAEAEIQARVLADKSGPRSPRKNLTAAVEGMPADVLGGVLAAQYARDPLDYEHVYDLLARAAAWREGRPAALKALQEKLGGAGVGEEETRELIDHLMWAELDVSRRLQLLYRKDALWRVDFQRVKEVLVKLFATDQVKEATALIQKYLSGLLVEDAATRRRVAENARYILHLIEKTGKGQPMLGRIGEIFLARIEDEADPEVDSRLAAALGFLADLRLRIGEAGAVLELMRRAESMAAAATPEMAERADALCQALSRVGNEKVFKELTDRHLQTEDASSLEAAEVLKRAGSRAASFLIDRLAEEEDRGNRARLVALLKEMNRSTSQPFTTRLRDPRWFLVRNVVHILGEIGDAEVLPDLRAIVAHPDVRVRKELVRTFARLGTPEAEDLIIAYIADPDRGVQVAAVNALSSIRQRRSAGTVIDILAKAPPYGAVEPEVREEAIAAAGRMALAEAVAPLAAIVTKKGFLGYAEPPAARVAAVKALAAIGTEEALAPVREAARADGRREVKEAAAEALGSGPPAVP